MNTFSYSKIVNWKKIMILLHVLGHGSPHSYVLSYSVMEYFNGHATDFLCLTYRRKQLYPVCEHRVKIQHLRHLTWKLCWYWMYRISVFIARPIIGLKAGYRCPLVHRFHPLLPNHQRTAKNSLFYFCVFMKSKVSIWMLHKQEIVHHVAYQFIRVKDVTFHCTVR